MNIPTVTLKVEDIGQISLLFIWFVVKSKKC